jgi:hypothetical protein
VCPCVAAVVISAAANKIPGRPRRGTLQFLTAAHRGLLWEPNIPRFPAVLAIGLSYNFLIREELLRRWAGWHPRSLHLAGKEESLNIDRVADHPNLELFKPLFPSLFERLHPLTVHGGVRDIDYQKRKIVAK